VNKEDWLNKGKFELYFVYTMDINLKVANLPLVLPCSGPVTHSGESLTIGKSHGKKPDRFSLNDNTDMEKV